MAKNHIQKYRHSVVGGVALLLSTPFAAMAQIEEIVVTARKVEESLQSTPVSVSAYTERGLETRGIQDTAGLASFTPNATFDTTSTFSGASSTFQGFIRGIGQSDFAVNTDPGVGVYIDDVYIARTVGSVFDLYDVEQVEVLKGPQGTLFGRNTIGGALNIRTARPNDEFSFKGSLELGRFNYLGLDGTVNVPLADKLYATAAFSLKQQDGFQERLVFDGPGAENVIPLGTSNVSDTNGLDGGGLDNQSARVKILWEPSDRYEATLSLDLSRIRDAAPPGTLVASASAAGPAPDGLGIADGALPGLFNGCLVLDTIPAAAGFPAPVCAFLPNGFTNANSDADPNNDIPFFSDAFVPDDIDTTFATGANFSNIDSYGISLVNTIDLSENLQLKSITAYRELDASFGRDIDGSPLDIDQTSFIIDQNQISQEIQLIGNVLDGRLDFTVGGFFFSEEAFQLDQVPLGGGLLNIFGPNVQDTRSFAGFGEANFEVVDGFKVLFGIRFTDERKELQLDQQNTTPFFGVVFDGLVDADGDTPFPRTLPDGSPDLNFLGPEELQVANFDDVSIRAGANWQVNEDVFAYFTFSQGFKSGGFTTRLTAPFNPDFDLDLGAGALETIVFQPETSDNFEVGVKTDLFGDKARVNLAAFWNIYDDIQIVVQRGITPANENAGDARIRGLELEYEFYPIDRLSLVGSVGYIDAEYTFVDPAAFPVVLGSELQNTPEFTTAAAVNYVLPVRTGDLTFNLNYSWRSEVFNDAENTPEILQDSVGQLGGQLKYSRADADWAVSLVGINITNERFIGSGFNSGALSFVEATFNRPAEWRLQLDYAF